MKAAGVKIVSFSNCNNYSPNSIGSSGIPSTISMNSIGVGQNVQQNQNPVIFPKNAEVGEELSMSAAHSNIARLVTKNEKGATSITSKFAEDITLSSALEKLEKAQDYNADMKGVVLDSIKNAKTNEDKVAILEKGLAFLETEKRLSECVQNGKMSLEEAKNMLTDSLNFGCSKDFSLQKLNDFNNSLTEKSNENSIKQKASELFGTKENNLNSSVNKIQTQSQNTIQEPKEQDVAPGLKEANPKVFTSKEHGNLIKNACESQQQSGTKPDLLPVNNSQPEVVNQFAMDLARGEKIEGWEVPSSVKKEDTPLDQKITFQGDGDAQRFDDEYSKKVKVLGSGMKAKVELYEGTGFVRKVFKEKEDEEINVAKEVMDNIKFLSQEDQGYLETVALPKGVIYIPSVQNDNNGDTQAIIYEKAEGKNFQDASLGIEWAMQAFNAGLTKGFDGKEVLSGSDFASNLTNHLKSLTEEDLNACCVGVQSGEKVKNAFKEFVVPLLQEKEIVNAGDIKSLCNELRENFYQNMPDICKNLQGAFKGIVGLHKAGFIYDDLKPDNMMMGPPPKVIDLGACIDITKKKEKNEKNEKTTACAPGYAPPEADNHKNTQASDVHKMGLCVASTLLGEFGRAMVNTCSGRRIDVISNKIFKDLGKATKAECINFLYNALPGLLKDEQFKECIPSCYSDAQLKFLGNLIKDCINPDLTKRPTSEQMLAIFEQFSAERNASVPNYEAVKAQAIKDHPKDLPPVLMAKIFSKNKEVREQAFDALSELVKHDPSYIQTPTYGLAMLRYDQKKKVIKSKYEQWKTDNSNVNAQLLDRVCLEGMEFQDGKGIPLTLHKMQLLKDANRDGDQNFKTRPMYGLYLFKKGETEKFQTWATTTGQNGSLVDTPFIELQERICLEGTSNYTGKGIGLSVDDIMNLGEYDVGIKSTTTYKLAKALNDKGIKLTSGKELEELRKRAYIAGSSNPPENGIAVPAEVYTEIHYLAFDEAKELVNAVDKEKPLGEGSFGVVYKIKGKDGKTYAVKIAKKAERDNDDVKKAFKIEKQVNEYVQGSIPEEKRKYFVDYHGGFEIGGKLVFITEFVEYESGKSLDFENYISKFHEKGDHTPEEVKDMLNLLQQGFEKTAVEESIGLINRDVKPQNFMVGKDANGKLQLKGMDYGEACTYSGIGVSDKKGAGSPVYMASEVLEKRNYSFGRDVFSMGITLMQGIMGNPFSEKVYRFPWKIAEFVTNRGLEKGLGNPPSLESLIDELFKQADPNPKNGYKERLIKNFPNKEQQDFLANLIFDCVRTNPEDRISAKQAAYLLGKFNEGALDYGKLKNAADYPQKVIPDVIIKMISSTAPAIKEEGLDVFAKIIRSDPAYIEGILDKIPDTDKNDVRTLFLYGLGLLRLGKDDEFKQWLTQFSSIGIKSLEEFFSNEISIEGRNRDNKRVYFVKLSTSLLIKLGEYFPGFKASSDYGLALASEGKVEDYKEWKRNFSFEKDLYKQLDKDLLFRIGKIDETFRNNEVYKSISIEDQANASISQSP